MRRAGIIGVQVAIAVVLLEACLRVYNPLPFRLKGETIVLQDVFVFEQTGYVDGKVQGRLRPTGIRPKFSEKFEAAGIKLPQNVFGDMSAGLR